MTDLFSYYFKLIRTNGLCCLLILPLWLLSACSQAVPEVAEFDKWLPGNPATSARFMQAHEVFYEKAGYRMRYVVTPDTYRGQKAWKFEIYFLGSGSDLLKSGVPDTIYLGRDNLAFLGRLLAMPQYTIDVFFAENTFSGALTPSTDSDYRAVTYNKAYPHGAFEPAIINYAIASLPLSVGFTASVPVFDLNNGSAMFWSNIKVTGKEIVSVDGEEYLSYKVESRGIKHKTLWIVPELPFAVKMETQGSLGTWQVSLHQ